jgi:hypothetical protein
MNTAFALLILAQASQLQCGPRAAIEGYVHKQYQESPIGAGIVQDGIVYVLNNSLTGTFTILLRKPDGTVCFIAAGKGWASMVPETPGHGL